MGSALKHVTGALTGHSGGSSSKTTEKANSTSNSESWLQQNPQFRQLETNAINEANKFNMPQQQLAGLTTNEQQALAGLGKGVDTSGYKSASDYLQGAGQNTYEQGNQTLQGALGTLQGLGNISQSDLQGMLQSEYNSDLVNSQIDQLKTDVQDQESHSVQALNQQATASGNMGNSRAGVAQGVISGQAQKAIASGSVQYRTAEEQAAQSRLMGYLNLKSSTANSLAGIGQNQVTSGLNQYGMGMNYLNQYNQSTIQNYQNQLTAGNMQRQYAQQQLDVNRQNEILRQSPSLTRLSMFGNSLLPYANLQTTNNNNGSSTNNAAQAGQGGNLLGGLMGMGGTALGSYFGGATGGQIGGMFGGSLGNTYGS